MKKLIFSILFLFICSTAYAVATYYPAAGTGTKNWSDGTAWAITQGGTAGVTAPTNADTVVFEGAVGTHVYDITVNTTSVTAKILNMVTVASATNNPILTFTAGQRLTIAGNVTFPTTQAMLVGTGILAISTTSTITSNGAVFPGDVYHSGAVTYTLGDDMSVTGAVYILPVTGNAVTFSGAHNLTCGKLKLSASGNYGNAALTFPASQTLTVTGSMLLLGTTWDTVNTTYLYTIKAPSTTAFNLNYSGTPANCNVDGMTFSYVNASGSAQAIVNYNGGTLTGTTNITNKTQAAFGATGSTGFFIQ